MNRTTHLLLSSIFIFGAQLSHAASIVEWNFGASNLTPNIGAGTASTVGTTGSFSSDTGSSDPVVVNNNAWSVTSYPAQNTGNMTEGVRFMTSTVGMEDIILEFDIFGAPQASRYVGVQYTVNGGTSWTNFGSPILVNTQNTWFNNRTVDLSSISSVDNNANFGVRILAAFAPSTTAYSAVNGNYNVNGSHRYDMVQIFGTAIQTPPPAVPEPGTAMLFGAGVGLIAVSRFRKVR